jgi:hypothetical protein
MKSILIKLLLVFSLVSLSWINYISNTFAEGEKTGSGIQVRVTEKIPGANCNIPKDKDGNEEVAKEWETQIYICTVAKGFASVTEMMWKIIKYFTYIAALWWVLFIIINGILYSMWWIDQSLKDESKKRITWTLIWLVLLMLSWVILNLVAPWIYK